MSSLDLFKDLIKLFDDFPELKEEILSQNKTFQFNVSDGAPFYVEASGTELIVGEGKKEPVAATISATDQALVDIFTGKLNGVQAFMSGKLKISGDIFSVQKLSTMVLKARR